MQSFLEEWVEKERLGGRQGHSGEGRCSLFTFKITESRTCLYAEEELIEKDEASGEMGYNRWCKLSGNETQLE